MGETAIAVLRSGCSLAEAQTATGYPVGCVQRLGAGSMFSAYASSTRRKRLNTAKSTGAIHNELRVVSARPPITAIAIG